MAHVRLITRMAALALSLGALTSGYAQTATPDKGSRFPAGLKWQTMDLVGFNFNYPGYEGTPAQRKLAESVWKKTMEEMPPLPMDRSKKAVMFVILTSFETARYKYIFTSLDAAGAIYPACEDPPNSSDPATPIYAMCPMRVVIQSKADGKATQQDFPGYCHLATNDEDQPKSRNYVEVAMDANAKNAYVRVVQYGKPAPECNRVIRLP